MLDRVRPGNTYLKNPQLQQWLIGKGIDKNFDGQNLRGVNLQGANLTDASFIDTDLSEANLQDANLTEAKLDQAKLNRADLKKAILKDASFIGTDLSEANLSETTFTGACIQDWNINNQTKFDDVICDYIYLKEGQQERLPHDLNRTFKPGEFTKYVEKALNTVDLIFTDGIDWNAFLTSFKELQDKYGKENVGVQAIEKKSSGAFVVRIEVSADANKAEIERQAKQLYETKLHVLEAQYRDELKGLEAHHKDEIISLRKEHNTQILELAKLAASRPITVEARAVAEHQSKNVEVEMNFQAPVTGAAGKVSGDMNVYASEQKPTLAEAADEIQKLLKQLEQTNPTATEADKIAYVNDETSPGFKRRAASALKAGSETAIEEFFDNPYVNVGKAVVKGWIKPE